MSFCSQKGCTGTATYTYEWPGAEGPQWCCVTHAQTVERAASALGFRVTLHAIGSSETKSVRRPYEPPQATAHALSWYGELTRLELLALEEELRRESFHGPAFKQWARMRIELCKKALDIEVRGKLASGGAYGQVCSCVNPPSVAIGETICPACGRLAFESSVR